MKVGDLVQWIGFPGADKKGIEITGPNITGVIIFIKVDPASFVPNSKRIDVAWGNGTYGKWLYPETLKVVNEN